jgi:hypothetical protein
MENPRVPRSAALLGDGRDKNHHGKMPLPCNNSQAEESPNDHHDPPIQILKSRDTALETIKQVFKYTIIHIDLEYSAVYYN